jgi:hypothetical protein
MENLPQEIVDECQSVADHFYLQHAERSVDFFDDGKTSFKRNTREWREAIEQHKRKYGCEWWYHIARDPFGETYWVIVSRKIREILREHYTKEYITQGDNKSTSEKAADIRLTMQESTIDRWIEKLLRKNMPLN